MKRIQSLLTGSLIVTIIMLSIAFCSPAHAGDLDFNLIKKINSSVNDKFTYSVTNNTDKTITYLTVTCIFLENGKVVNTAGNAIVSYKYASNVVNLSAPLRPNQTTYSGYCVGKGVTNYDHVQFQIDILETE